MAATSTGGRSQHSSVDPPDASDFAGGGTDGSGHIIQGGYAFADNWAFKLSYFLNERGENAGDKRDYQRLMADLSFTY